MREGGAHEVVARHRLVDHRDARSEFVRARVHVAAASVATRCFDVKRIGSGCRAVDESRSATEVDVDNGAGNDGFDRCSSDKLEAARGHGTKGRLASAHGGE